MEFRILGQLQADAGTGQGPAAVRQPLLRSALAVLLLRANRPCPRDWLIDALWGNEPPSSPETSLRVCISRLRRDLGDCAARLESVGPPGGRTIGHRWQRGYTMRVRPGELDVDEFGDLLWQGRAELDTGNAAAAATSLVQALALWGDPPLPDLPETEAITADVSALTEQHRAASEALIDARMRAGEHVQVLGQLRAMVRADPARERTCAQLMRAYHALGMHAEALDAYQTAREATLRELGAEPGPALSVLHRQILAEELALHRSPASALMTPFTGQPAVGGPDLTRAAGPLPLLFPAWQLPAPPSDFLGRGAEIERIGACLAGPGVPVVVIAGGPGIGKSALAAAVALAYRDRFPDGQLYAELSCAEQARDSQAILADLLCSLGMPACNVPPAGPARPAMYRSLLADRKVLVVADGATAADQVRALSPTANGAAVLVTSRNPLREVAGARTVALGPMPDDEALALLGSLIGANRVADEPQSAARVLHVCAGSPLAIRVAGTTWATHQWPTLADFARELDVDQGMAALVT